MTAGDPGGRPQGEASPALVAAVLVALALLLFRVPLLGAPVLVDDHTFLSDPRLTDPAGLARIATTPLFGDGPEGGQARVYYRPVFLASLAKTRWLANPGSGLFHVENVVIHSLVAWLVFLGLRPRTGGLPAFLGSLVLLTHPVSAEAVAWISGRSDPLATLLALAACLAASARPGPVAGAFLLGAGVLAKETALVFLPALIAVTPAGRRRAATAAGLGVVGAVALVRARVLGGPAGSGLAIGLPSPSVLAGEILHVLDHLAGGSDLTWFFHPGPGLPTPLGAVALAGLAATAGALARSRSRTASAGLLWMALAVLPVAGVVHLPFGLADRYLYPALPGLSVLVASGVAAIPGPGRLAAAGLVAMQAARLAGRAEDFEDPIRVLARAAGANPDRALAWLWLAEELLRRGRPGEALAAAERGLEIAPLAPGLLLAAGRACREIGLANRSRSLLSAVPEGDPLALPAGLQLAFLERLQGRGTEARERLDLLVARHPEHVETRVQRGELHLDAGRLEAALEDLEVARRGAPARAGIRFSIGLARYRQGRVAECLAELAEAVRLDPGSGRFRGAYGQVLMESGREAEARIHLEAAARMAAGGSSRAGS